MTIKIKVTKEVLRHTMMCGAVEGEAKASHCAFAYAVRDFFPDALVSFDKSNRAVIYVYESLTPLGEILLPSEAREFIRQFDNLDMFPVMRLDLPEIAVEVTVPTELIDAIGISQAYKILSESKTLELISI